jgi:hypothetical protein
MGDPVGEVLGVVGHLDRGTPVDQKDPLFSVDPPELDFGLVSLCEPVVRQLLVRNRDMREPLVIHAVSVKNYAFFQGANMTGLLHIVVDPGNSLFAFFYISDFKKYDPQNFEIISGFSWKAFT